MNIKRIGTKEGRELYEVIVRKEHAAEDYAEVLKIQEESIGKRRFFMQLEGFSENEYREFMVFIQIYNNTRNAFMRNGYQVSMNVW